MVTHLGIDTQKNRYLLQEFLSYLYEQALVSLEVIDLTFGAGVKYLIESFMYLLCKDNRNSRIVFFYDF